MSIATATGTQPRVSVILPVRNGADSIGRAVDSILRQTFEDWELLLIDDGSTDGTQAILKSYTDPRIRTIVRSNQGLTRTLNQGIELAKGAYIARHDHDDVSFPERFARQVEFLDRNPEVDLLGTRALLFTGEGEPIGLFPIRESHEEICARPWNGFYLAHPTWMGRTAWFRRFRYRLPEVVRAEDQDLLLRAFDSSRFACLPSVLLGYRVAPVALSKLVAVRLNLARSQFFVNLRANRPRYAVFGASVFLAKAAADLARYVFGSNTVLRYGNSAIPAEESIRWRTAWQALCDVRLSDRQEK